MLLYFQIHISKFYAIIISFSVRHLIIYWCNLSVKCLVFIFIVRTRQIFANTQQFAFLGHMNYRFSWLCWASHWWLHIDVKFNLFMNFWHRLFILIFSVQIPVFLFLHRIVNEFHWCCFMSFIWNIGHSSALNHQFIYFWPFIMPTVWHYNFEFEFDSLQIIVSNLCFKYSKSLSSPKICHT